jgi:hypothetical protein
VTEPDFVSPVEPVSEPDPAGPPEPVTVTKPVTLGQPVTAGGVGHSRTFRPAGRMPVAGPDWRPLLAAARQRLNWSYVLGLALLVAIGMLGYVLVSGSGSGPSGKPAASPGSRHSASRVAGHGKTGKAPAAPTASPSAPAQLLSPASAMAFGPGGASQGDNPQLAPLAINGGAWHTDWYASAAFGNLEAGTGLLLDMGRSVTITSAQMTLGNSAGADVQLRTGNTPTLATLSPVAGASNAGGVLQLSPSRPVTCRYVLIWFTGLPPDPSGTYQATVSDVRLQGLA